MDIAAIQKARREMAMRNSSIGIGRRNETMEKTSEAKRLPQKWAWIMAVVCSLFYALGSWSEITAGGGHISILIAWLLGICFARKDIKSFEMCDKQAPSIIWAWLAGPAVYLLVRALKVKKGFFPAFISLSTVLVAIAIECVEFGEEDDVVESEISVTSQSGNVRISKLHIKESQGMSSVNNTKKTIGCI